MSTQIIAKKSRKFINNGVNTPLCFSSLSMPEIKPMTVSLKVTTKRKAAKDLANLFGVKPKMVLEDDQVHLRQSLANSMDSFVVTSLSNEICKSHLQEFKEGITKVHLSQFAKLHDDNGNPMTTWQLGEFQDGDRGRIQEIKDSTKAKASDLCQKMATEYLDPIFNKIIGELCSLQFSKFNDDGTLAQDLYRQSYVLIGSLKNEAQSIIGQCYQIGLVSGRCDGKSNIDHILGSISKEAKVYCFKTAEEMMSIHGGEIGRSSFNRHSVSRGITPCWECVKLRRLHNCWYGEF